MKVVELPLKIIQEMVIMELLLPFLEIQQLIQLGNMKRVMIIDALNAYFRAYIVDPSMSTNGQPIGGVKGFLKILQKLVRENKPDMVVVVWDGPGRIRQA